MEGRERNQVLGWWGESEEVKTKKRVMRETERVK